MSLNSYLLQLPTPDQGPARVLQDGADALVVVAESTSDAKLFAQNLLGASVWGNVTPAALAASDLTNWRLRVRLYNASGVEKVDLTVVASGLAAAVAAIATLTNDGTNVTDGDTVTIGSKVYTLQSSLTNVDGNVKIGASNTATMTNLFHAINASGGTPGTDYAAAMTAHPDVTATNPSGTTVVITAKVAGKAMNAEATTETSSHLAWGGATMSGGYDAAVSGLAALMVAALNANGYVANAAFNTSTHVLTIAGAADNKGDNIATVEFYPPQVDSPSPNGVSTKQGVAITGYVGSITDGGSSGSAVTATLVANTYTTPTLAAKGRSE